jgi:hypothetical protein
MTLSREVRLKNIDDALRLMMHDLGDESILNVIFKTGTEMYAVILQTTWLELKNRGLVRGFGIPDAYQLTGRGWLQGLRVLEKLDAPELKEKTGKMGAVVKAVVKGRATKGFANVQILARESGLPEAFIQNAIDSDLFGHIFKRKGASWHRTSRGLVVEIPIDFGQEPL